MKAVIFAAQAILAGDADLLVAGGMESMSHVPFYLPALRGGARMGHAAAVDGLIKDGAVRGGGGGRVWRRAVLRFALRVSVSRARRLPARRSVCFPCALFASIRAPFACVLRTPFAPFVGFCHAARGPHLCRAAPCRAAPCRAAPRRPALCAASAVTPCAPPAHLHPPSGLWDPSTDVHMGECAELCAERFEIT
jgi:hypothetical protein